MTNFYIYTCSYKFKVVNIVQPCWKLSIKFTNVVIVDQNSWKAILNINFWVGNNVNWKITLRMKNVLFMKISVTCIFLAKNNKSVIIIFCIPYTILPKIHVLVNALNSICRNEWLSKQFNKLQNGIQVDVQFSIEDEFGICSLTNKLMVIKMRSGSSTKMVHDRSF